VQGKTRHKLNRYVLAAAIAQHGLAAQHRHAVKKLQLRADLKIAGTLHQREQPTVFVPRILMTFILRRTDRPARIGPQLLATTVHPAVLTRTLHLHQPAVLPEALA
jgi:hypothetical protein